MFYLNIVFQKIQEISLQAWTAFISQDQDKILIEISIPVILIVLWIFFRYLTRRYRKLPQQVMVVFNRRVIASKKFVRQQYLATTAYIKNKSLLAATFFPHLLLISPVVLGIYFLPTFLAKISQGYILIFVSLLYPIINTVYSIEKENDASKHHSLVYWVVFSLLAAIHGIVQYTPFAWTLYETVIPLFNNYLKSVTVPQFLQLFQNSLQNPYLAVFINTVVPDPILLYSRLFHRLAYFGMLVPYYASVSVLTQPHSNTQQEKDVLHWW